MSDSSITITVETGSRRRSTCCSCSAEHLVPATRPTTPRPTRTGVFGMALATATPSGACLSSTATGTPAAIETTTPLGFTDPAACPRTSVIWSGLTARKITSASLTASVRSATRTSPRRRHISARSSFASTTVTCESGTPPRMPSTMAPPIAPPPTMATRFMVTYCATGADSGWVGSSRR